MFSSIINKAKDRTLSVVENQWGKIEGTVIGTMLPFFSAQLPNQEVMTFLLEYAYSKIPNAIQKVIPSDVFVRFALSKTDTLIPKLQAMQASNPQMLVSELSGQPVPELAIQGDLLSAQPEDEKQSPVIASYWAKIEDVIVAKLSPVASFAFSDEQLLVFVLSKAYDALPFPVRLVVSSEDFIDFGLAKKSSLMLRLQNAQQNKMLPSSVELQTE